MHSTTDQLLIACDTALRTLFAQPHASKPCPTVPDQATALTPEEKNRSASLMRVNHVGEVCAQALYTAQATGRKKYSRPFCIHHSSIRYGTGSGAVQI